MRHSHAIGNLAAHTPLSVLHMFGRPLLILSAALLVSASCDGHRSFGQPISAREAIPAKYKAMETAFHRGDADAIASMYTDDAEWYVPDAPVLKGRLAIAQAWKANVGAGGNRLRVDVAEVEETGDRAHEVGRFTISAPDGAVLSAGKYIVIWARQSDGEWKTYRDIFNWDIPPRQATTP